MKKEVADAWVKDLRDNPPQAKERLYDGHGYCCLGRLCVVLGYRFVEDEDADDKFVVADTNEGGELPSTVVEDAGLQSAYGAFMAGFKISDNNGREHDSLVDLNDEAGYNFAEIADVIEQHWEQL